MLRRAEGPRAAPEVLRVADLIIDLSRHTLKRGEALIGVTPTEFNLLVALAREPGRVFTRLQLLEVVQGDTFEGYERTVDAHVKNLRAKLEPEPRQPRYLLTVYGVGYKFADE